MPDMLLLLEINATSGTWYINIAFMNIYFSFTMKIKKEPVQIYMKQTIYTLAIFPQDYVMTSKLFLDIVQRYLDHLTSKRTLLALLFGTYCG